MLAKISLVFLFYLVVFIAEGRIWAENAEAIGGKNDLATDNDDDDTNDKDFDDKEVGKRIFAWQRRGAFTPSLRSWGRGFDRISYSSPLSRFHKRQEKRHFDKIGFSSPLSRFTKKHFRGFDRIGYKSVLSNFNKRHFRGFDKIAYASPLSAFTKRDDGSKDEKN